MHEIIHYLDEAENDLYQSWLESLRDRVILLTSGGDKKSQNRDIERAVNLLKDWERRNG